jgi:galactokinase
MKQNLEHIFQQHFGCAPSCYVQGPGRVNLIGEHTDYNQGFVLPAAINFSTTLVGAARNDRQVNVIAMDYGNKRNSFSLDDIQFDNEDHWSNYVRGVAKVLSREAGINGADLLITGNVPQGAGLSSSASLEIALLKAFSDLYQLDLDGVKAALLGQEAENKFVGCSCGIMDQLVSAMGKRGEVLLLDCQSLEFKTCPIPPDYQLVIINSNVKHKLVNSEYNLRRQECEQAAAIMKVNSLRYATMDLLQSYKTNMPDTVFRRARHVITENQRVLKMFSALESHDFSNISKLMALSHQSMREDFEITLGPIDLLVELVGATLGDSGGVRMTGGGFGGCIVSLAPWEAVQRITETVEKHYFATTGIKENIYICTAEQGAFV